MQITQILTCHLAPARSWTLSAPPNRWPWVEAPSSRTVRPNRPRNRPRPNRSRRRPRSWCPSTRWTRTNRRHRWVCDPTLTLLFFARSNIAPTRFPGSVTRVCLCCFKKPPLYCLLIGIGVANAVGHDKKKTKWPPWFWFRCLRLRHFLSQRFCLRYAVNGAVNKLIWRLERYKCAARRRKRRQTSTIYVIFIMPKRFVTCVCFFLIFWFFQKRTLNFNQFSAFFLCGIFLRANH